MENSPGFPERDTYASKKNNAEKVPLSGSKKQHLEFLSQSPSLLLRTLLPPFHSFFPFPGVKAIFLAACQKAGLGATPGGHQGNYTHIRSQASLPTQVSDLCTLRSWEITRQATP